MGCYQLIVLVCKEESAIEETLYSHHDKSSVSGVILQNLVQTDLAESLKPTQSVKFRAEGKKKILRRISLCHTLAMFLSKSCSVIIQGAFCCLGGPESDSCFGFDSSLKRRIRFSKWWTLVQNETSKGYTVFFIVVAFLCSNCTINNQSICLFFISGICQSLLKVTGTELLF